MKDKKIASFLFFFSCLTCNVPFESVIMVLLNLHIGNFIYSLIQMTVL